VVAYLEARRAVVVWTDPLCPEEGQTDLLAAFSRAMRAERRSICLIAVGTETARCALELGYSVLKIGEEPWFDLEEWRSPRGNRGKKLRWALNHARKAGVEVDEYRPGSARDAAVEAEVEAVLDSWRSALGRTEADSFLRAAPFEERALKRLFLARRDGQAEAVLSCAELSASRGWYFEDNFRAPGAVNGATELLVFEALNRLRADGFASAGFALAPMRGVREQLDSRARWLGYLLSVAIHGIDRRYGFHAMSRYESRFRPSAWRPRYIAFLPALPRPAAVRAAVRFLSS
jgi:phosphatidylglycerol lysyltransferase